MMHHLCKDDPIVGDTNNSSPSNFEAFEAIFKARFARLVIASFRSFRSFRGFINKIHFGICSIFSFWSILRYYKQVSFLTSDGESCPPTFEYTRRSHLTMDSARVDPENYCDAKPTKVCNYCITGPSTSKDYFYDCEFKSQKTLNYPKGKCSKFNIRTNGFC